MVQGAFVGGEGPRGGDRQGGAAEVVGPEGVDDLGAGRFGQVGSAEAGLGAEDRRQPFGVGQIEQVLVGRGGLGRGGVEEADQRAGQGGEVIQRTQ